MAWNSRLIRREQKSTLQIPSRGYWLAHPQELHYMRYQDLPVRGFRGWLASNGTPAREVTLVLELDAAQELATRVLVSYKERFVVLVIYFWTACIFWGRPRKRKQDRLPSVSNEDWTSAPPQLSPHHLSSPLLFQDLSNERRAIWYPLSEYVFTISRLCI